MYKRITHTIVEEHFAHPMAAELAMTVKATFKAPLRYYPNGEQIPSDLPKSYRPGTVEKECKNCRAFDASKSACLHWLQPVRSDYVCDAWTVI